MGLPRRPFRRRSLRLPLPSAPAPLSSPLILPWHPQRTLDCLILSRHPLPRRPNLSLNKLICKRLTKSPVGVRCYYCDCYYSVFSAVSLLTVPSDGALSSFVSHSLSPFCKHLETLPGARLQTSAELTKLIHNHCPARETEKKHITMQGSKSMDSREQPAKGSTKEGCLTYLVRLGRRSNQGRLHGGGDLCAAS